MTQPDAPELRLEVPTLEPDDAFVDRLAALAARSAPPTPLAAARSAARGGWRVTVAAAGVAGVVGGGAWLAAAVTGSESPAPPPPTNHTHRGDDATPPSTPSRRPLPRSGAATPRGGEDASRATDDDRTDSEGRTGPGAHGHVGVPKGQHGRPGTPPGHVENHHGDQGEHDAPDDTDHPDDGDRLPGTGDVTIGNPAGGGDAATGDHGPVEDGSDDQPAGG